MNEYDELLTSGTQPRNEYDAILEEQAKASTVQVRASVKQAAETTPDRAAEVIRLSDRMKLPPAIVERNFDDLKKRNMVDGNDYDRMLEQSPKTVEWLKSPENAAISADDVGKLGALEWTFTAPGRAWKQGVAQVEFGNLMSESLFRSLTAAENERLNQLRTMMLGDLGAETWWGKALVGGANQLPMLAGGLKSGAETGLPMALMFGGAATLAGPGAPLTVPAAVGTGYFIGQTQGAALFGFRQEAGFALDEFSKFKDELGRPLDPQVAKAAAIAAGGINAGLEAFQLHTLLKSIPGLEALTGGATRSAIRQALASPTIRAALATMMRGYAGTLTTETMTEVAQRAVTILAGELGKVADGQKIAGRGSQDILGDLVNEAVQSAQAFTYLVAPGHVARAGMEGVRIREAAKQEAFFTALGQEVATSKVFERLPEKMQDFVREATKDGPIDTVYMPVEAWSTYFQSKGLDPAAVLAEVTGDTTLYEAAVGAGTDIPIPMEKYATILAPGEHNAFLATELRLRPDEMNAREANELAEVLKEELAQKKDAEKADKEAAAGVIGADVKAKLIAAGVEEKTATSYAAAHEAAFNTIGARAGIDPVQLYQNYGLQVGSELRKAMPGGTTLHQNTIDGRTGEVVPNAPYFSQMARGIESAKMTTAPAGEWKKFIESLKTKGVKKEEIESSGIMDWLDLVDRGEATEGKAVKSPEILIETNPIITALEAVGVSANVAMQIRDNLLTAHTSDDASQTSYSEDNIIEAIDRSSAGPNEANAAKAQLSRAIIKRHDSTTQVARPGGTRVTRQDVLDFLEENGTRVETTILGEPPPPKATTGVPAVAGEATDGLPEGYTVEFDEGARLPWDVYFDGDIILSYRTRQEAIDGAIETAQERENAEPSDDDVKELAQRLLDDDIPEMAERYARESSYTTETFDVEFQPPDFKVVELPPDMLRPGRRWGVILLDYDELPAAVDDDSTGNSRARAGFPDDADEFREMWPEGPTEKAATEQEFSSEADAVAWANDNGYKRDIEDGPKWVIDDGNESGFEGEYDSFDEAHSDADSQRQGNYESEYEYYTHDGAPTLDDFGDRYYEMAREQLRDKREDERHPMGRPARERDTGPQTPRVRHGDRWQSIGGHDYREMVMSIPTIEPYNSSDSTHFQTDTGGKTIAWSRFKIHEDENGLPTIWIEELQSQRAQHGREQGFKDELPDTLFSAADITIDDREHSYLATRPGGGTAEIGHGTVENIDEARTYAVRYFRERDAERLSQNASKVPSAPFVKDTQAWTALVIKRLLRYAADKGITQIAWTTGPEQVRRYGTALREQVDNIAWVKTGEGIHIAAKEGERVKVDKQFTIGELKSALGAAMYEQIVNDPAQSGNISGGDIRIDDLGMANYYGDENGLNPNGKPAIVPIVANKIAKQLGGEGVKSIDIEVSENGTIYKGAAGISITPEMAEKIKGGLSLFQNKDDTPRASISFSADRQFRIDLLKDADLSSFIHESGHFWLEVLGDVVDQHSRADPATLTPEQIRQVADYQTLLDWMGVKTRGEIKVEHHEKFARAIERYFMEGKAPNPELQSLFARFRSWLTAVYRSFRELNVTLTPEVTAVLDRMLATDEEIQAAEQEAEITPLFVDDAQLIASGIDPGFVNTYRKQVQKASDTARDELQAKLMRTLTRERKAWWADESAKLRPEVAADVQGRKEWIALTVMQTGKMPDGTDAPSGRIQLSRKSLEEGEHKMLPRGITTAGPTGVSPQVAAEMFGYSDGGEFLRAMRSLGGDYVSIRRKIDAEVDVRMREKFGDPLVDGSMVDAAREAVHNAERSKVIEAELRALSKLQRIAAPAVEQVRATGEAALKREQREREYNERWKDAETKLSIAIQKGEDMAVINALQAEVDKIKGEQRAGVAMLRSPATIPPIGVIRSIAKGRIAQMRVRDIKPSLYLVAARKASKEATIAAGQQDFARAVAAKQRELLNVELYRVANDAIEEVDKATDFARSLTENKARARIGKAGQSFLDQIDGFLDRYDFAKVSLEALDRRANLAQWIAEQERAGVDIDIPDEVIAQSQKTNYKDLTLEQLRGVTDSMKHIAHIAGRWNKLLKAKKKRELDEVTAEVADSIFDHAKSRRGIDIETRLPGSEAGRFVDGWFASHRKLASISRQADGGHDGGAMWEYIVRPLNEAADTEASMNADATKALGKLFDAYAGKEQATLYTKTMQPALGISLSKMGRLMIALNSGNADNKTKIMEGYRWNEQQIQAVLDTLDERDWKFVQGVWDYIDTFWPEIEAKEKRVNGIAPEKVEATAIATRFGQMKGGYFPLRYDDRQSGAAYGDRVADVANMMKRGAVTRSTTRRGHTKERVEGVKRPVRLDFGVIFEHVTQVVHDLSHHEALLDVNAVLGSKTVEAALKDVYGDVVYKHLQDNITDIAAGDIPAQGTVEQAFNYVRQGATIAGLGWNAFTSLLQPFGIAQSMVRVGPKWIGRGIARWARDAASLENTAAWIRDKSPLMKSRMLTQQREINEIRNQIGVNTGKFSGWVDEIMRATTFDKVTKQDIVDSYFWLIYKGQQVADIPTWLGAYEKAMSDPENDEARAIALADQAVIDSQGGGQLKDLSKVQRGGPMLKLWTNFYSYFNVTWNLSVESVQRTDFKSITSIGRLAVDFLLLYTLPASLTVLMRSALGGDDDDDLVNKLIAANLSYMTGVMLGLREIGGIVQGYTGYEGPAGARIFSGIAKLVKQAQQGEADAAFWKSLNNVAGVLLHYPAGQVQRTMDGFAAMVEGRTYNPLALLFGAPKE